MDSSTPSIDHPFDVVLRSITSGAIPIETFLAWLDSKDPGKRDLTFNSTILIQNLNTDALSHLTISPVQFITQFLVYLRKNYEAVIGGSSPKSSIIEYRDQLFYYTEGPSQDTNLIKLDVSSFVNGVSNQEKISRLSLVYVSILKKRKFLNLMKEIEFLIRLLCSNPFLTEALSHKYCMKYGLDLIYFSSTTLSNLKQLLMCLSIEHLESLYRYTVLGVFYPEMILLLEEIITQKKSKIEEAPPELKQLTWDIQTKQLDHDRHKIVVDLERICSRFDVEEIGKDSSNQLARYLNSVKKSNRSWAAKVFVNLLSRSGKPILKDMDPNILKLSDSEKLEKLNQRMSMKTEPQPQKKLTNVELLFKEEDLPFLNAIKDIYDWEIIYIIGSKIYSFLLNLALEPLDWTFNERLQVMKTMARFLSYITTMPYILKGERENYASGIFEQVFYEKNHVRLLDIIRLSKEYGILACNLPWIIEYLSVLKFDDSRLRNTYINPILDELGVIYKELVLSIVSPQIENNTTLIFTVSSIESLLYDFNYDISPVKENNEEVFVDPFLSNQFSIRFKSTHQPQDIEKYINEKSFIAKHFTYYHSLSSILKELTKAEEVKPKKKRIEPNLLMPLPEEKYNEKIARSVAGYSSVIDFLIKRIVTIGQNYFEDLLEQSSPFDNLTFTNQAKECDDIIAVFLPKVINMCMEKLKRSLPSMIPPSENAETKTMAGNYSSGQIKSFIRESVYLKVNELYLKYKKIYDNRSFANEILKIIENGKAYSEVKIEQLYIMPTNFFGNLDENMSISHLSVIAHFFLTFLQETIEEEDFLQEPQTISNEKSTTIEVCNLLMNRCIASPYLTNTVMETILQKGVNFEESYIGKSILYSVSIYLNGLSLHLTLK